MSSSIRRPVKMPNKDTRSAGPADGSPGTGKAQRTGAETHEKAPKGNDAEKKRTSASANAVKADKSAPGPRPGAAGEARNPRSAGGHGKSSEEIEGRGDGKKPGAQKATRAKAAGGDPNNNNNNNPNPINDTKKTTGRSVTKEPVSQTPGPSYTACKTGPPGGKLKHSTSLDESRRNEKDYKKQPPPGASGPAAAAARRLVRSGSNPSKTLHNVLESLKVKKDAKVAASRCVNDIQDKIISHLKKNLNWCQEISVLKTGSYYEYVKICEPDEFDVMLTVKVNRGTVHPYSEDGAFYTVQMKRDPKSLLSKFLNDDIIKASEMLNEFREEVKKAVEPLKNTYTISVNRKKKGCPAVTLEVNQDGKEISIDFVLGLELGGSWPSFTNDGLKIEKWLSNKERIEQRRKPYYLVPKYEGRGNAEQDGVTARDAWRISFSHVEKDILRNHGNTKTCCNNGPKCCRKDCLKLLKYLLHKLKEIHPREADELCSYHAKTTLLHACTTRVEDGNWAPSDLNHCFQQLLEDFEKHLKDGQLSNFFIPSQNLLKHLSQKDRMFLVDCIQYQRNNGYPLFQQDYTGGTPKQTDLPKLGVCDCQKRV